MSETLCSGSVTTKLQRIAELASKDRRRVFTSVAHVIDLEWMKEAYRRTRKDGATGVDDCTAADYAANLEVNLSALAQRVRSGSYKPPPVRRALIPKDGGKTRPIGIPTFEDKIAQRAVAMVLEAIYEQSFHDLSFGFRPGRSAHDALVELQRRPTYWQRCWVIEADIESFFDTIDHTKLRSVLDQRVRDGVIRRLIDKWLRAGVLNQGRIEYPEFGTPQGGVISPILANIFLDEVLDRWFTTVVWPRAKGLIKFVRYADDFVLLFNRKDQAERVMAVLPKRFEKFGLRLHPEKTRMLSFNCPGRREPRTQRERSFDFLGFTHYWVKSRSGGWVVRQTTAKARFRRSLRRVKERCRRMLHAPVERQHQVLCSMLRGHNNYFGITGNGRALERFRTEVRHIWGRSLARRSGRRFAWQRFAPLLERFPLPLPHPPRSVITSKSAT
jgi:RNA-directed DNA polymerase